MKYSLLFFTTLITILGFHVQYSSQRLVRCPLPKISNGRARQRGIGRAVRFNCNPGFTLVGNRIATCTHGKWNSPFPVCVKAQCAPIVEPANSLVVQTYNGGVLMFFCNPGYKRQGASEIYCDGKTWNDSVPTCIKDTKPQNVSTSCDFEADTCMWEQDPMHDFDWRRHNFNTPSWHIGTGPSHDHTLGPGRNGYYLYIEATAQLENSTARIMSPLYNANLTESGCFSFWYHMFGITIGSLNIYFKAEGETNRTLMFTKSGNQGNHWFPGLFQLPKTNDSFQIIMEGVRGAGYLSDIAVDDVAILQGNNCTQNLETTTENVATDGYDQVEIVNAMQSCLGRCIYTSTGVDPENGCQCDLDCSENGNCCADYLAFCLIAIDNADSTTESSENATLPLMEPEVPTKGPDRVPIPINPKDDIDPYTTKNSPKSLPTTTLTPTTTTTATRKKPSVTSPKTMKPTRRPITTVPTVTGKTINEDKSDNQSDTDELTAKAHSTSSRDRSKVTLPGIIAIVVGAIVGVAGVGLIVFLVLQKRNSYKSKSGTSALSEDSDVRFLTSDEMLDFNLARPEDMEM